MRRRRVLPVLALGALAAVGALLLVLILGGRGGDTSEEAAAEIVAEGSLQPLVSLFGDTVTATVVTTLNHRAIDPASVRFTGSFSPFQQVGKPRKTVRSAGDTTSIETTFVLRCLTNACVPGTTTIQAQFEPAALAYATRAEGPQRAIEVSWPTLTQYTRIHPSAFSGSDPLAAPWRADLVRLPAASYRVPPGLVIGVLLVAGGLLVLGGGVLAYRMLPRRARPPEPEAPPEPELTALERALAVLESPAQADGVADRRRALELISDEATQWADSDLTQTARKLAWSEDAPEADAARALVARVRVHLEEQADGRLA